MRLVSIAQNGEQPTAAALTASSSIFLAPPKIANVPPPPAALMAPLAALMAPPAAPVAAAPAGSGGSPYSFSPDEQSRYYVVFSSTDSDNDGFIQGGEAVALFSKSGLDRDNLRKVWALSDVDKDNKLNRGLMKKP
jgi:hypothetical protein